MGRRHRKYVVGFDQDREDITGNSCHSKCVSHTQPFTKREAEKYIKLLVYTTSPLTIYELVPIKQEHPDEK